MRHRKGLSDNSMQRSVLRAAADAEHWASLPVGLFSTPRYAMTGNNLSHQSNGLVRVSWRTLPPHDSSVSYHNHGFREEHR
jgi:hypothetical protein